MTTIPAPMRAALERPRQPKTFCSSSRRNKWGHRVASCSFVPGHHNDHRDVHSGRTWA